MHFRLTPLLLLLACCLIAPARAHLPEYYGRDYVLAAPGDSGRLQKPEKVHQTHSATPSENADAVSELERQLGEAEAAGGPYSIAAGERLLGLGALYAEQERIDQAIAAYEQALYILRVNDGLQNSSQLDLLHVLAELYRRSGDYAAQHGALRSAFRIHGMGAAALDNAGMRDSLQYFALARDAYIRPDGHGNPALFLEAFNDNRRLLDTLLEEPDVNLQRLREIALSQLRNLYILIGTDLDRVAGNAAAGDARSRIGPAMEYMFRLQPLGYGMGRDILENLINRLHSAPLAERAKLLRTLGDWHQWNLKWRSAKDTYLAVFRLLDGTAEQGLLGKWFAEPAELPDDPALWQTLQDSAIEGRAIVEASYRVSYRGDVSRVSADVVDGADEVLAGRVRTMLKDSHFRPAILAGQPVAAEVTARRYKLLR